MPTVLLDFFRGLRHTHSTLSEFLRLAPSRADCEFAAAEVSRLTSFLPAAGAAEVPDSPACSPAGDISRNRSTAGPESLSSLRADLLALSAFVRTRLNRRQRRFALEYLAAHGFTDSHHSLFSPLLNALEPAPRGPHRFERVQPPDAGTAGGAPTWHDQPLIVRQGRLGDCWLIAVLHACEVTKPGFTAALITHLSPGFVRISLHRPFGRDVTVTDRVPQSNRAGGRFLEANAASLVEKGVAATFGRGRYRLVQRNFAGTALSLLTGHWCPARPVPSLERISQWLEEGRPVVASTLLRRRGAVLLPREDDPKRSIALMTGHVYAVIGVGQFDEDGNPAPGAVRVHMRNPLLDAETGVRRTDLCLSATQLRKAFISVNVGPPLA